MAKKEDPNALGGVDWSQYKEKKAKPTPAPEPDLNRNVSQQLFAKNSDESITPPFFATAPEVLSHAKLMDHRIVSGQQKTWDDRKKAWVGKEPTYESDEALMARKVAESDNEVDVPESLKWKSGEFGGLTKDIAENGYNWEEPIRMDLQSSFLTDGHHRVAVMARDRPDEFLPLRYHGYSHPRYKDSV
jgi:hypothetical protein